MTDQPIDNKLGLQVVPDLDDRNYGAEGDPVVTSQEQLEELAGKVEEGVTAPENFADLPPEKLAEIAAVLREQNESIIGQLAILGKSPTPMWMLRVQFSVLLDFMFPDDARQQFDTACHMQVNQELKVALAQSMGLTVGGQ